MSVDIAHTPQRTIANAQLDEENRRQYENMKMITDNLLKRSFMFRYSTTVPRERENTHTEREGNSWLAAQK